MYINKINGKRYVGQAVDFNRRHRVHNLKSTDKFLIDRAFNKYGEENFEIVILKKDLQTQCLLNFWECYYIENIILWQVIIKVITFQMEDITVMHLQEKQMKKC